MDISKYSPQSRNTFIPNLADEAALHWLLVNLYCLLQYSFSVLFLEVRGGTESSHPLIS